MDNRRQFQRFKHDNKPCRITIDDVELDAFVSDESIGGLKVTGVDFKVMTYNKRISIEFDGAKTEGVVKNVIRNESGLLEICVQRLEPGWTVPDSTALLANTYFKHESTDVVCIPIGADPQDNGKLIVRLFNGHEFSINRSNLHTMTRTERGEQLHDADCRNWISRLYGVPGTELLDFEFGSLEA